MTSAPIFLYRCPACLDLHPWRAAPRSALPLERVEPHACPHGRPCGPQTCTHGRGYGDVRAESNGDGPTVLACACIGPKPCQECSTARAAFFADRDRREQSHPRESAAARLRAAGTCVVCREVERQIANPDKKPAGGYCVTLKRRTGKKDEVEVEPSPRGCPFKSGEKPPPWCFGATDEERDVFLGAFPEPMRATALDEARRANKQEGAAQKQEAPKVKKEKRGAGQGSLF